MDQVRVYVRHDLLGFEHLHARFERYHYARHAHAGVVIGLVDEGVQSFVYRGARHRTGPDGIFFVNAGEAHTGEPNDADGYTYRGVRLDDSFFDGVFSGTGVRRLIFKDAVVHSTDLAQRLRSALLAIEAGASTLCCEELILDSLRALSLRHGAEWREPRTSSSSRRAISRACELIEQTPMANLSLQDLSEAAEMSLFHFAHAFRREVGSSAFIYAEAVRIDRAKKRLRQGAPLADVAFELGYTDQSHFTRKFKQHEGMTPGQYRRAATGGNARLASG